MGDKIVQAKPPRDPVLDIIQPALKIGIASGTHVCHRDTKVSRALPALFIIVIQEDMTNPLGLSSLAMSFIFMARRDMHPLQSHFFNKRHIDVSWKQHADCYCRNGRVSSGRDSWHSQEHNTISLRLGFWTPKCGSRNCILGHSRHNTEGMDSGRQTSYTR